MFWWFQRGDQFLRFESRKLASDSYELVIMLPDGTEQRERFADETALDTRQKALIAELEGEGWSGPHGWHV